MDNRILKFRAWDIPFKRMCLVKDIDFRFDYREDIDGPVSGISIETDDGDEITLNYEIMQFTGLKDKNGKEIYEGDIVNPYGTKAKKNRKVVIYFDDLSWDSGGSDHPGFYLYYSKDLSDFDGDLDYGLGFYGCEIIGNIYENPELLENEQKG